MNKSELVDAVASKSGLTKADSQKAVSAVVDSIKEELQKGEKVVLIGFGTFSVSTRSARKGVNPRTKAVIDIPAKKTAKFKAGAELSAL